MCSVIDAGIDAKRHQTGKKTRSWKTEKVSLKGLKAIFEIKHL